MPYFTSWIHPVLEALIFKSSLDEETPLAIQHHHYEPRYYFSDRVATSEGRLRRNRVWGLAITRTFSISRFEASAGERIAKIDAISA